MKRLAYIGHYTDESRIGIRTVSIDAETGAIEVLGTVPIDNAIWMVQNRGGDVLYATCEGGLAAYRADGSGALAEFSHLSLPDLTAPCHAALSPDGTRLAWAEYRNGVLGLVALAADGSFVVDSLKTVRHEGRGFSSPRQDSAHAHCVQFAPDGKYLFAVDLGLDEVKAYDPDSLAEIAGKTLQVAPGHGPRHLVFHPSGTWAAIDFELANRVALYRYKDGEAACAARPPYQRVVEECAARPPYQRVVEECAARPPFEECANLSTLPDDFKGHSQCAAVKFSEDGGELYVSNRGHDSLAVFTVDTAVGTLARRGILPLGGSFPRDFAFAPGGNLLVACLKKSGIVRTYAYDRAACRLVPRADLAGLYRPLFVLFMG